MAQFIQVGNAFINLEQVTVLDVDNPQGRTVLRVFGPTPGEIWQAEVQPNAMQLLQAFTGATQIIQGRDQEGGPIV